MKTNNIFIENIYPNFDIDEALLLKNTNKLTEFLLSEEVVYANSCLSEYNYETLCFDIVLVDNENIHRINKEYRQKDKPTDVISFAIFADSPKEERFVFDNEINLGEIIVSLDKIKEQADANSNSFEQELYFLIAHGILHCLGFDHNTQEEYEFMMDVQERAKAVVDVKVFD